MLLSKRKNQAVVDFFSSAYAAITGQNEPKDALKETYLIFLFVKYWVIYEVAPQRVGSVFDSSVIEVLKKFLAHILFTVLKTTTLLILLWPLFLTLMFLNLN